MLKPWQIEKLEELRKEQRGDHEAERVQLWIEDLPVEAPKPETTKTTGDDFTVDCSVDFTI